MSCCTNFRLSTLAANLITLASQKVVRQVPAAVPLAGRRGRGTADELMGQVRDGIGDIEKAVVVEVAGPRRGSLGDYILRVIRGRVRPMSLAKIADRVKKAGYKTKSKNLPNMVSNTLAQMAGVKKVGRGLYRA